MLVFWRYVCWVEYFYLNRDATSKFESVEGSRHTKEVYEENNEREVDS
jgi:hypothetical protein